MIPDQLTEDTLNSFVSQNISSLLGGKKTKLVYTLSVCFQLKLHRQIQQAHKQGELNFKSLNEEKVSFDLKHCQKGYISFQSRI